MDVDNAISDSLEVLRPKLQVLGSLEEANKEVEQLERDTLKKISEFSVQLTIHCMVFAHGPVHKGANHVPKAVSDCDSDPFLI